jgi:hypothetical protein
VEAGQKGEIVMTTRRRTVESKEPAYKRPSKPRPNAVNPSSEPVHPRIVSRRWREEELRSLVDPFASFKPPPHTAPTNRAAERATFERPPLGPRTAARVHKTTATTTT